MAFDNVTLRQIQAQYERLGAEHPGVSHQELWRQAEAAVFRGEGAVMTSCPVCGNSVSTRAPTCPHCGHPLNPHKSSATMVLVFGIAAVLLPMYGVVFGGLALGFGNREVREIDAGLRLASGRTKARVGRVLGVIGLVIWGLFWVAFGVLFSLGNN